MLAVESPFPLFFDLDGTPLNNGKLYFGTANLNPETSPVTVYWDEAGTQAAAQPIQTIDGYAVRNGTPAAIFVNGDYSLNVRNNAGVLVFYAPASQNPVLDGEAARTVDAIVSVNATGLTDGAIIYARGRSAAGDGGGGWFRYSAGSSQATDSGLVFAPSVGSGRLFRDGWVSTGFNGVIQAPWFGTKGDGVTNDTTAMKAFFDACIERGGKGYISEGTYLITPGVLVFDNGHLNTAWPEIETAGFGSVTFTAATTADAPFIKISNGTAVSGAGQFWRGGALGGITFNKGSGGTTSNCHGLSLRGITDCHFGHMRGNDLGGSTVFIEPLLFGGSNPDPYNVASCKFDGVEGNRNKRYAFENQNYVGLSGNSFRYIRAINTILGGFFGFGALNSVGIASMGECSGWAFDDGTNVAATGGTPSRFTIIDGAEIDGMENGIRINRTQLSTFNSLRFVHRFRFDINTTDTYWPRTCIDLNGGTSANTFMNDFKAIHRIETAMGAVLGSVVGTDPITTVNTSTTVTYNTTDDHHFANGWTIAVLGAVDTNGIPAAELNGEHVITVTGAKSFTYTVTTAATSSGTGGGSAITLSPYDALGQFVDAHNNASISGTEINQLEINNAGFTSLTNDFTRLYSNVSASTQGLHLLRNEMPIGFVALRRAVSVRGSANTIIKTDAASAWPADASNFFYDSELLDRTGLYNTTTAKYRIPFTGTYRVSGKICMTAAVGTRLRISIIGTRSGVNTIRSNKTEYQVNAGAQHYYIDDMIEFVKDDLVFIGGSQNTAGNITATTVISQEADNKFTIEPVYG